MAWSPDGGRFYLSHSFTGEIFTYAFDPAGGRLGERALFAKIPEALGLPGSQSLRYPECFAGQC